MLYLRRVDCSVDWTAFAAGNGSFVPLDESIQECGKRRFSELKTALEELSGGERALNWAVLPIDDQFEYDSATSIESSPSFREGRDSDTDDELQFRRKKRARKG